MLWITKFGDYFIERNNRKEEEFMQKSTQIILILLTFILTTPQAFAGTEQGTTEIQAQGSFVNTTNSENDDNTSISMGQLSVNYFLTDWFSIGGSGRISASNTDYEDKSRDDTTISTTFLMFNSDLYLGDPLKTFIPYLGIRIGIANYQYESGDNDNSSSTASYGGHMGLKIFPSENISWNLELDMTCYTPEAEEGQDEATITDTSLLIGFSYYF
jgi:opacity protein-like surface antigen